VTKYCRAAPNICWSSVWNLLHVNLLTSRILRWLLEFRKYVHVPSALLGWNYCELMPLCRIACEAKVSVGSETGN
jgi:hypothetical protein